VLAPDRGGQPPAEAAPDGEPSADRREAGARA
jgi:hypothetical protein